MKPRLDHYYQTIPGWFDFQDIYIEAVAAAPQDGARFVEIGNFMGRSLAFLAVEIVNSGKRIELHSIDIRDVVDIGDTEETELVETIKRYQGQRTADVLASNLLPVLHAEPAFPWTHHVSDSVGAARMYADASFDFVFLDTIHLYAFTIRELRAWWPKVKRGGVFAGHDHTNAFRGVEQACREFFTQGYQVQGSSFVARKR